MFTTQVLSFAFQIFAMTLLEVIIKASANNESLASVSEYPIVLNPDDVLLRPKLEDPNPTLLVNPVIGWQISQTDSEVIEMRKKFYTKLKQKLKNPIDFDKDEFLLILNQFLEKIRDKVGVSIGIDKDEFLLIILVIRIWSIDLWRRRGLTCYVFVLSMHQILGHLNYLPF